MAYERRVSLIDIRVDGVLMLYSYKNVEPNNISSAITPEKIFTGYFKFY